MAEWLGRLTCNMVSRVQVFLSDFLDLSHGSRVFKSSATLVNSQLVSLPPAGDFKTFMFHLFRYFLSSSVPS